MEWHSDGAKGEFTILVGLEDVSPDQGFLRVVPGSHMRYVDGVGHEEVYTHQIANRFNNVLSNVAYSGHLETRRSIAGVNQTQLCISFWKTNYYRFKNIA
jgi:2-keto-3-deoxy-galactonokinase